MYCKNCGKTIEGRPKECPYCKADVVYEGGDGFWNIMSKGGKSPTYQNDTDVLNKLEDIKKQLDKKAESRSAVPLIILCILAALCIFFCALNMLKINRLSDTVNSGMNEAKLRMEEAESSLNEAESKISEDLNKLYSTVNESLEPVETPMQPAPEIVNQPTGIIVRGDEGESEDIFIVEVCYGINAGDDYRVEWKFRSSAKTDEEFETLDKNRLDFLGLKTEEAMNFNESRHCTYRLTSSDLKIDASGVYQLVIKDNAGNVVVQSEELCLEVEAKEIEPVPFESSQEEETQ